VFCSIASADWDTSICSIDTYKSLIGRLDYGNATLYDLPSYLYNAMQPVLNTAARSVFLLRRFDLVTPALVDLQCAAFA
jgi:hypothetical protein